MKYYSDTVRSYKRDVFSKNSTDLQNKINENQLQAIKTQALISEKNYTMQKNLYDQQHYENRPILMFTGMRIDSALSGYDPVIEFSIANLGKRPAVLYKEYIVVLNKALGYHHMTTAYENGGSVINSNTIEHTHVQTTAEAFKREDTFYYIQLYYSDGNLKQILCDTSLCSFKISNNHLNITSANPDVWNEFADYIKIEKRQITGYKLPMTKH